MKITHAIGITAYITGNTSAFVFLPAVLTWGCINLNRLLRIVDSSMNTQLIRIGFEQHSPEVSSSLLRLVEETTATTLKWNPRFKKIVFITGAILIICQLVQWALELYDPYDPFHRRP